MGLDFAGWFSAVFGVVMVGMIAIAILIVFMVVRVFRRGAGIILDPAEAELRQRLARGEIDMAEFEVRLRALRRGDAS